MIRPITIHCPICGDIAELFLSVDPSMIVLNCPSCWAPLMYDGEQVSIADFSRTEAALKEIASPHPKRSPEPKAHRKRTAVRNSGHTRALARGTAEKPIISDDDLLNLHIDLANSRTVEDFLSRY